MDSPFLDRSLWITDNVCAAAIRDVNPVSPGHTLIVPKRPVPSIFDCTHAEVLSIWLPVEECKWALDAEFKPQGHHVGINCGADAGQPIFHAHVHLVPRYRGDHSPLRRGTA
jgi:diadenosine tetraphosphate (Ap4A) HIT family hydrolase